MKLLFEKNEKMSKLKRYIIYTVFAVLLSIIDVTFISFISVAGLTPDLLLILCIWITLSEGQFEGLLAAFTIGLMFDIISLDVPGSNAMAKTFAAMIAGWFYSKNRVNENIGGYKFLLIIFLSSIVHNLLYFILYIKYSELDFFEFFGKYGIAISFYTTVIAIFPMLMKIPKNRLIR